uniref:Uncharacterized protein n=1 Tax=Rousettus aegyptiacus TaxID=9407 RepID=A0A7J8C2N2_ROUAE|nr:hypothetical protein HJG63_009423 [Rousettus aegyptiacus]
MKLLNFRFSACRGQPCPPSARTCHHPLLRFVSLSPHTLPPAFLQLSGNAPSLGVSTPCKVAGHGLSICRQVRVTEAPKENIPENGTKIEEGGMQKCHQGENLVTSLWPLGLAMPDDILTLQIAFGYVLKAQLEADSLTKTTHNSSKNANSPLAVSIVSGPGLVARTCRALSHHSDLMNLHSRLPLDQIHK